MLRYLELCVVACKVCIRYEKRVSGEERSLGSKNMLDHLMRCSQVHMTKMIAVPVRLRAPTYNSSSILSSSNSIGGSNNTNSKAIQRPCYKTLDSYVIHSGKVR